MSVPRDPRLARRPAAGQRNDIDGVPAVVLRPLLDQWIALAAERDG